jgi:hypothetical protein
MEFGAVRGREVQSKVVGVLFPSAYHCPPETLSAIGYKLSTTAFATGRFHRRSASGNPSATARSGIRFCLRQMPRSRHQPRRPPASGKWVSPDAFTVMVESVLLEKTG